MGNQYSHYPLPLNVGRICLSSLFQAFQVSKWITLSRYWMGRLELVKGLLETKKVPKIKRTKTINPFQIDLVRRIAADKMSGSGKPGQLSFRKLNIFRRFRLGN